MINLTHIQKLLSRWRKKNFPYRRLKKKEIQALQMATGMAEEAGEVAHYVLKATHGIRGGQNGLDKQKIADGVIDSFTYGLGLLDVIGVNAEKALKEVIGEVLKRDWINNPTDGRGKQDGI